MCTQLYPSWKIAVVVVVECCCCLQPFDTNVISWVQSLQPPPPAWTVDRCWQYVTSFGICHKGTCRLLRGPTSFDRMSSGLGWSGSDSGAPSSIWVYRILVARLVESSTREDLTTGADFHSSRHWDMMFVGWISVHSGLCAGRQFLGGRNTFLCSSHSDI